MEIIVRQCDAHGVDTSGHKVISPYKSSKPVVVLPRPYITVTILMPAVMKSYGPVSLVSECVETICHCEYDSRFVGSHEAFTRK